jgi:hypothetical protein
MSTDIAILGGRSITFPSGWTSQRLVAVLGGAHIDARAAPGDGATLRLLTIFGGAEVLVAEGTRVTLSGLSLFGGRKVDLEPRDAGPEIRVKAVSVFGGIRISSRS